MTATPEISFTPLKNDRASQADSENQLADFDVLVTAPIDEFCSTKSPEKLEAVSLPTSPRRLWKHLRNTPPLRYYNEFDF